MGETPSERICSLLKENPKGLSIEEVSQRLAMNRTTAAKYLNSLVNSGDAELRTLGRAKVFSLSRRVPLPQIIDLLSDQILVLDRDLEILEANSALQDWFGIPATDLIRRRLDQTPLNSLLSSRFYDAINQAFIGKGSIYETTFERQENLYYFKSRFIPLVFGEGKPGAAIIFEDITETRRIRFTFEKEVKERTDALTRVNEQLIRKIEEHRQTLSALRESEARYRRIFETANEGIWVGDQSFTIVACNQKAAEMLGYTHPDDLIGRNFSSFIFPEDLPDHLQRMSDRAQGRRDAYERKFRRKDGSACWVLISANPLLNTGGFLSSSFIMITDISAQKEMELELLKKSRYYEQLLKTSSDAIHVVDEKGNLREWNDAFLEHLGYTAAEAAGLNARDWDADNAMDLLSSLRNHEFGQRFRFETRHRTKEGIIKDVEVCATRITIDGEEMMYSSARDITQRKRTEQELRERANWISNVAATIGGLIWETDAGGLYLQCSPTIESILGYTLEEVIGKMHYYDFFPAEEKTELRAAAEQIFDSLKPFRSFHSRVMSKDGRSICFETTGIPMFDPQGTFTGYRGIGLIIPETENTRENKTPKRKTGKVKSGTKVKKKDS